MVVAYISRAKVALISFVGDTYISRAKVVFISRVDVTYISRARHWLHPVFP